MTSFCALLEAITGVEGNPMATSALLDGLFWQEIQEYAIIQTTNITFSLPHLCPRCNPRQCGYRIQIFVWHGS